MSQEVEDSTVYNDSNFGLFSGKQEAAQAFFHFSLQSSITLSKALPGRMLLGLE